MQASLRGMRSRSPRSLVRLVSIAAALLLAVGASVVAATAAQAVDQLDQSYESGGNNTRTLATEVGQTFTVGQTGDFTRVALEFSSTTSAATTVRVYAVAAGVPTGAALRSTVVPAGASGWTDAVLAPALPVVSGSSYAVTYSSLGTVARFGSGYAGGVSVQWNGSTWNVLANVDLNFRTYVAAAPTLTGSPPDGVVGDSYDFTFTVAGLPAPTVSATGTLPDGLVLDSDGRLHGTPSKSGDFSFTVTATNGVNPNATKDVVVRITARPAITGSPGAARVGDAYSFSFVMTGSPAPKASGDSGALPPGLTLGADGVLKGTPTKSGKYSFTVKVVNSAGSAVLPVSLTVKAAAVVPPKETSAAPPAAKASPVAAKVVPTAAPASGTLPKTGADLQSVTQLAGWLLFAGALLIVATRHRRGDERDGEGISER